MRFLNKNKKKWLYWLVKASNRNVIALHSRMQYSTIYSFVVAIEKYEEKFVFFFVEFINWGIEILKIVDQ